MINQYSPPADIVKEFYEDFERATYWANKYFAADNRFYKMCNDANKNAERREGINYYTKVCDYHSPKTGNTWAIILTTTWKYGRLMPKNGGFNCFLYRYTEEYMMMMMPSELYGDNGSHHTHGVAVFTEHVFQRMHERMGIEITDRMQTMINLIAGDYMYAMDIRNPRAGESDMQAILRLPGSWIRGHYVPIGGVDDGYVVTYRTFYTDKHLTQQQWRYLRSFRKIADKYLGKEKEYREYVKKRAEMHLESENKEQKNAD